MSSSFTIVLILLAAYLIGAIPFGYLIAKAKGVDLFQVGSGNIGATNVGRVLGRKWGVLVFLLDFLKGALPVALTPALVRAAGLTDTVQPLDLLRIGVALAAFAGHLFPIYLRFRGGKGVATGFGTVFILVPGPALVAILIWLATVVSFRIISVGSIIAVVVLCGARFVSVTNPFDKSTLYVTLFCIAGALIVIVKHRTNLKRLLAGSESQFEARPMVDYLQRAFHLVALALWLGSAVFFSFLAAPAIFASFREVAKSPPSDRTAYVSINEGLDDGKKDELGSALAGAAVGPVFPRFFGLHAVCGAIALITAAGWWRRAGRINRTRCIIIGLGLLTIVIGCPISQYVTELRLKRFSPDADLASAAKSDFVVWHLISLALSFVTTVLAFVAMLMAVRLPEKRENVPSQSVV